MIGAFRRRHSRRAVLIGGAVAGAGVAAGGGVWALRARGGEQGVARTPEPSPAAKAGAGPTSTAAPSGGTARLVSPASFNFDTFDAQRTGEASVAEVLGRTHSRLVNWSGFPNAVVVGDLARAWEQRDATSWAFHLDPAARWQDREPLNGRAVTADDVARDLQRRIALAAAGSLPTAQRAGDVERILRVTAPDPVTVVVESSAPDPFLLDTLAGRFAVVQAPEAVERFSGTWAQQRPEEVVGSGAVRAQSGSTTGCCDSRRVSAGT